MDEFLKTICGVFALEGDYLGNEVIKCGNINDTYRMDLRTGSGMKSYIVQRINHNVFRHPERIISNVCAVTEHIAHKLEQACDRDIGRKVLRLYVTTEGKHLYISPDGDYWRVMNFIYNAESHDRGGVRLLHKTGEAFGTFQSQLSDFPAEKLYETIPDFHDTEKRFDALEQAARADVAGRLDGCRDELAYLLSMRDRAPFFTQAYARGEIPMRVTHNDTKCNNVMFDRDTKEPLAVIDLDTVMPGFTAYDYGDAVRFAANTAAEDEPDTSKVSLDLRLCRAFTDGFVGKIRDRLRPEEVNTLPDGLLLITLELAARFLTDYLDGDRYFKIRTGGHNLVRARNQIALAQDICRKMDDLREIVAQQA